MRYNIIDCKESDLKDLYDGSALTFEVRVINDATLEWLASWLRLHDCEMKQPDFYVVKGKLMNEVYHLAGNKAYKDSLNILCIKLSDLTNVAAIAIPKFELDGRWFDDVVEGNARRE
jgi:hypothetical protein